MEIVAAVDGFAIYAKEDQLSTDAALGVARRKPDTEKGAGLAYPLTHFQTLT